MTAFELTSKKGLGMIRLTYGPDGCLTALELDFKQPLKEVQFRALIGGIQYLQADLYKMGDLGFDIKTPLKTNEKLGLFCQLYEQYFHVKYKVSKPDSGKIKLVWLDEAMLHHYFKSERFEFKGKQSVANLVKYYNELLRDFANQGKAGNNLPNGWDPAYYATLDAKRALQYEAHLRNLGLRVKKDRMGKVLDWE